MKNLLTTSLLLSLSSGFEWSYLLHGDDWPRLHLDGNKCGGSNQSPIDLKSTGWPTVNAELDNF